MTKKLISIAISKNVGHSDIFLIMTCNPQWPEIKLALLRGQEMIIFTDLAAGVFRFK